MMNILNFYCASIIQASCAIPSFSELVTISSHSPCSLSDFSDDAAVKIEDLQEKVVYYNKVVQKEEVSTQSFLYSPLFTHAVKGNLYILPL